MFCILTSFINNIAISSLSACSMCSTNCAVADWRSTRAHQIAKLSTARRAIPSNAPKTTEVVSASHVGVHAFPFQFYILLSLRLSSIIFSPQSHSLSLNLSSVSISPQSHSLLSLILFFNLNVFSV